MENVPQLLRSLIERLVLNPGLTISEAKEQVLADLSTDREFVYIFSKSSALEKLLLLEIAADGRGLFSTKTRARLTKELGIKNLTVAAVQSAIRSMQKKLLIGRFAEGKGYFIDDPNFKKWLLQRD